MESGEMSLIITYKKSIESITEWSRESVWLTVKYKFDFWTFVDFTLNNIFVQ